ncbi:venom acid phosphatase Acph-1-like [Hylaeus volcanicus]|uniref:venom acid phosphatase Acph-1-like n=1 Tax=Hylaeus volcanicus TaxID=313075 RepID=UPI0023B81CAC|nr:venom acid phosphatase Acph-1-like [Hylaeus volcanicus]
MNIAWTLTIIACQFYFQPCLAELKLIQTVFRHGNRMPTAGGTLYPNDPYANISYEPAGHGGLTNVGKMSAYKLGQYFRERYDEFLGTIYSKDVVWFRADEIERVVMSAELVAAGLYPPCKEQMWNPYLDWQPIPVWAPAYSTDYLYIGLFCANAKKWREHVEKTDANVMNIMKQNREIYRYLSQHTGGNITQRNIFSLRQMLYAQRDIGLELPKWTKKVFPNGKLNELATFDILIRTWTPELRQLSGGIWIQEWLKNVDNHINGTDTRKAFMYAAHELTIAPILVVLDNFDYEIPSYSSTVIFELHEDDNQYYVQVFYRNKDQIRTLRLPGCDDMCPLVTFKNIVAPLLPRDVPTLCGNTQESKSALKQQSNY